MKNLFLLIAILVLTSATPTSVRKVDQAEYQKYLTFCKTLVPDRVTQVGKIKLVKLPNGYWRDREGNYQIKPGADTTWYKAYPSASPYSKGRNFTFNYDEKMVTKTVVFTVERRKMSVRDFYEWWLTNKYTLEIIRLENAIETFGDAYKGQLTKQLNYIKSELAKIK